MKTDLKKVLGFLVINKVRVIFILFTASSNSHIPRSSAKIPDGLFFFEDLHHFHSLLIIQYSWLLSIPIKSLIPNISLIILSFCFPSLNNTSATHHLALNRGKKRKEKKYESINEIYVGKYVIELRIYYTRKKNYVNLMMKVLLRYLRDGYCSIFFFSLSLQEKSR